MEKDDLQHLLKLSREKQLRAFCPFIKGTCREDCVCYEEGSFYKYLKEDRIYEACCTNVLVSGLISIE